MSEQARICGYRTRPSRNGPKGSTINNEGVVYFESGGKDSGGMVSLTFEMIEALKKVEEEEHEG